MKRLILSLALLGIVATCFAENYTLTLSSLSATAYADFVAASYPSIDGNVKIDQIEIYATGSAYDEQVIEVYNDGDSTTTATIAARYVIRVASSVYSAEPLIINYPHANPLTLSNPTIKKEDATSTVYMNLIVR